MSDSWTREKVLKKKRHNEVHTILAIFMSDMNVIKLVENIFYEHFEDF